MMFLYLFLQPSSEAARCARISEFLVLMVVMSLTMTVFFPSTYQLSCFFFQIRRTSCVSRRAGLGKQAVRASFQERVT